MLALLAAAKPEAMPSSRQTRIDPRSFRVVESESGPISYYTIVQDPEEPFIRGVYRPPLETVTLGFEVPHALRQGTRRFRWRWRAQVLPITGNECRSGFNDSAAVIYVTWKRGLKWYAIKYVWTTEAEKGRTCDPRRSLFVTQDTVIVESGGPVGVWKTEEIDPAAEFRAHFAGGDPKAEVPDLIGIGLMSDGDQTHSPSAADYAGFLFVH